MTQQTTQPSLDFTIKKIRDGISLLTENYVSADLRCNIWHIQGRDKNILVDSGMGLSPLKSTVTSLSDQPIIAVSSHAHFDHMGGAHEFDCHMGHCGDSDVFANPTSMNTLAKDFITADVVRHQNRFNFDVERYKIKAAPLTGYLDEGDVLDLGDRVFTVLHLPGHTPGSIALYETRTQTLFSGDIIYQGGLIDNAWHSNVAHYEESMQRLRELPVSVVHAGHEQSFGKHRMLQIIDEFLKGGARFGSFPNA